MFCWCITNQLVLAVVQYDLSKRFMRWMFSVYHTSVQFKCDLGCDILINTMGPKPFNKGDSGQLEGKAGWERQISGHIFVMSEIAHLP